MADDLVVSVGANIAALERQMKAAAKESDRAATEIENRFKKVNPSISTSALTGALKGFAAAFTVDRIIRGLADANAELVRVGETAKRVGLDLQRFQELQFAGRQNGLTGKDFGAGLEGLAEKLNEARQKENELSQLFADNNVKLKDRKGEVIGVNDALGHAADLVKNAATEFDKIKIAEALGLTRDWVPLLEQGAQAINKQASAAREAGAIIDADIIQKAKDFERDWASAIDRWASIFKANAGGIIGLIDTIISKAGGLLGGLDNYSKRLQAVADIEKNGLAGASRDTLNYTKKTFGADADPIVNRRLEEFGEGDREGARGSGFARTQSRKEFEAEQNRLTGGTRTNTSSLYGGKGGGGGGGGKSEEEGAQERLDRYIESLTRQRAVMEAEIATVGKSNAEKRAAIEIAKAQVDLDKLGAGEKANYIAKLTEEVAKNEEVRASKERLEAAQKGVNDAQKYFGNAAVDALEDMIVNGARAEDVMKRLASSIAKAAIQAMLFGEGPLAGIFGTKGVGGSSGGLLGGLSLFGRATGGPVNAGQPYRVGERGPETFVPTTPGKIVPNRAGGSGPVSLRVVNNGPPMNASVQQRSDGNYDVILDQIEAGIAARAASGRSPLNDVWRRDASTMRG